MAQSSIKIPYSEAKGENVDIQITELYQGNPPQYYYDVKTCGRLCTVTMDFMDITRRENGTILATGFPKPVRPFRIMAPIEPPSGTWQQWERLELDENGILKFYYPTPSYVAAWITPVKCSPRFSYIIAEE